MISSCYSGAITPSNGIAEEETALLLGLITRRYDIIDAFIDEVGPIFRYQPVLEVLFPDTPNVKVSEKAEDRHLSAAAFSMIAKHLRDTGQERFAHHCGKEAADPTSSSTQMWRRGVPGYSGDEQASSWLTAMKRISIAYPSSV